MKKRIQLSTVKQEACVEVVFVNANLICKVINSSNVLRSIIEDAENRYCIKYLTEVAVDQDGNPMVDEDGCAIQQPICDKDGKLVAEYSTFPIDGTRLKQLNETVLQFLDELRNAMEGDEQSPSSLINPTTQCLLLGFGIDKRLVYSIRYITAHIQTQNPKLQKNGNNN